LGSIPIAKTQCMVGYELPYYGLVRGISVDLF